MKLCFHHDYNFLKHGSIDGFRLLHLSFTKNLFWYFIQIGILGLHIRLGLKQ